MGRIVCTILLLAACAPYPYGRLHRSLFEGGDEPLAFIAGDVGKLNRVDARAAIDEAMALDPTRNPRAAMLAQNDLWERFDALAARDPDDALLLPLAQLIRHLALPAEPSPPSNALTAGMTEVRTELHNGETWDATTRHSDSWGQRTVFRVFVGPSAVVPAPHARFPAGTRLTLVGTPLVFATDGQLHPAPFPTTVESRIVGTTGYGIEVLHARRSAGLEPVPLDAPVPPGSTCMPDLTRRVALKDACQQCHRGDGGQLTGPLDRGELRVSIETDPGAAAQAVIARKTQSPSYALLRRLAVW
jgi:hypothetical protein